MVNNRESCKQSSQDNIVYNYVRSDAHGTAIRNVNDVDTEEISKHTTM